MDQRGETLLLWISVLIGGSSKARPKHVAMATSLIFQTLIPIRIQCTGIYAGVGRQSVMGFVNFRCNELGLDDDVTYLL
jgi:hypothetical protein